MSEQVDKVVEAIEDGAIPQHKEMLALAAEYKALKEKVERWNEAGKAFVTELDAVTPEIISRFQFCEIHGYGMKYEGPTYQKELQLLRDLITE